MQAGGYGSRLVTIKNKYPFFGKIFQFIYPPMPSLNTIPIKLTRKIQKILFDSGQKKVLNVGSGSATGCGRKLWKNVLTTNVTNVDIAGGDDIDLIADAHNLPFENESFDTVIMQAVIEHLHSPNKAVDEAFRVLKKGGILYLEVPFLQGFHADPHDYQRFTEVGLKKLVEKFDKVLLSGVSVGPFCSLVWIIRDLVSNLFNIRLLNYFLRFIISWILAPFRYLDYLVYSTKASKRLASEYYILTQK